MPRPSSDDIKARNYEEKPKPRGYYNPNIGRFVDYGIPSGGELVWGSRGYGPRGPVPQGMTPDQAKTLWRVCGVLKRAWEYPALMRRFAAQPIDYLVLESKSTPDQIAGLLANPGDPVPNLAGIAGWGIPSGVPDFANAVGMPAGEVLGVQQEEAAARLALYLMHTIHEKKLGDQKECK